MLLAEARIEEGNPDLSSPIRSWRLSFSVANRQTPIHNSSKRKPGQRRRRQRVCFLVVVSPKDAIHPDLPDSAPLPGLNSFSFSRWTIRMACSFVFVHLWHWLHPFPFCRRFGCPRLPEKHDRADEFFGIIIGIPVVVLAQLHVHRLDETLPQVIDKARLGA